jgi:hypothetical protein
MARLYSCGFELNSVTAGMEAHTISGTPEVQGTTKRSGNYALKIASLVSGTREMAGFRFIGTASSGPFFLRGYLAVTTYPSITVGIVRLVGAAVPAFLNLKTDGKIELRDEDGLVGTSTNAVPNDTTWHRIELRFDGTKGANLDEIELRIDGTSEVLSTTRDIAGTVNEAQFGGNTGAEANTAGEWYWDDIGINDSTGSAQTSWPDAGAIIHLKPNGEGDADTAITRVGTDSGTNFGQIDEETPNDGTDGASMTATNSVIFVDVEASPAAIGSGDTVKFVAVGGRIAAAVAGTTNWFPSIMSQSAGTQINGTSTTIALATYATHDDTSGSQQYKLTQYTDPQGGGAWTKALLDTMQIGAKGTDGNPDAVVTTLWALVEYNPVVAGGVTYPELERGRRGISRGVALGVA